MTKNFFGFFVDNYRFTLLLTILVGAAGLAGLNTLQRESRPPVDFATVTITTAYPGASSTDVEDSVTTKIEDKLTAIDGIKEVTSTSEAGLSTITIRIDMDGLPISDVVDEIQRAVQRVSDLPTDLPSLPRLDRINVREIPVIELALISKEQTLERDRLAEDLAETLEDISGVAQVRFAGLREREYRVELNATKMTSFDISIQEVLTAVQRHAQNIPAGYIETDQTSTMVRVVGKSTSAKALENIIIRSNPSGSSVRIRNIGRAKDVGEDPDVMVRVGDAFGTIVTVTKKGSADAVNIVQDVRAAIKAFNARLPSGIEIIVYNDEADRIEKQLGIVLNNALGGLILVLVFLLVFLPGTIGIMTALSLPLTVLATVALMPYFGASFNTITTLAFIIAIGMLVDNAVVISENYASLRARGIDPDKAAKSSVQQFFVPLTATYATTVLAFLPMLVTKGIMGEFIKWIPIVVTIALTASLAESFLLLPARIRSTIRKDPSTKKKTGLSFDRLKSVFQNFVAILIRRRYLVLLSISMILVGSMFVSAKYNRFELFPKNQVEFYFSRYAAKQGTSIYQTDRIAKVLIKKIEEKLGSQQPDYVIARSGVQKMGLSDPLAQNGDNVGMVTIKYSAEAAGRQSSQEILALLRSIKVPELQELTFDLQANGPPVGKPLTVTLRSNNEAELLELRDAFKIELSSIDGVKDISDDRQQSAPEYRVVIDSSRLAFANLDVESLGLTLRAGLEGTVASTVSVNNDDVDIRVRFEGDSRASIESLQRYLIRNKDGLSIELASIAKFEKKFGPPVLKRRDFQRSITITADVDPEKITSIELNKSAAIFLDRLTASMQSVSYIVGGEQESTNESLTSLKTAMMLAAVGILAVLVWLYRSFSVAFLILSSVPLGLVGVSLAFFLHQRPLSFMAIIGVVGLAGVVVNSAIVLISFIEDLRLEFPEEPLDSILAMASAQRLRAVAVTSLTTVSGLMPTAYGLGGADQLLMPMTLALAWGLVTGTILTLFWIPCGYAIIADIKTKFLHPAKTRQH